MSGLEHIDGEGRAPMAGLGDKGTEIGAIGVEAKTGGAGGQSRAWPA